MKGDEMNQKLEEKLEEIKNMESGAYWYIVKQQFDIIAICYMIKFLDDYQKLNLKENFEQYIENKMDTLNKDKNFKLTTTHRVMLHGAYLGLFKYSSKDYAQSIITDVYREIYNRCGGSFENIASYQDILDRQIEKIFISSKIDEKYQTTRREYRLCPLMFLYKILLMIGCANGGKDYRISINEFKFLVATSKRYKDCIKTICLILSFRNERAEVEFSKHEKLIDTRFPLIFATLSTLEINNKDIKIKDGKIQEVAKKVLIFENNLEKYENLSEENYLNILISSFDLKDALQSENLLSNIKGRNLILYGVPGCGKSYYIDNEICNGIDNKYKIRVVFYADYLYTDFIGQIKPTLQNNTVEYKFIPGPFTKILKNAINNPTNHYYLIIEEINRGNAPAIFGDIFQLLDRDKNGRSIYTIHNLDIAKTIYEKDKNIENDEIYENKEIYIPSNLSIIATMNSSDQNIFTLDTAFQRRWELKHIPNNLNKASTQTIASSDIAWKDFATVINNKIAENSDNNIISEDKRLGAFFITENVLESDKNGEKFAYKVIKYLYDDAFKFDRNIVFKEPKILDDLIDEFIGDKKFDIFTDELKNDLKNTNKKKIDNTNETEQEE